MKKKHQKELNKIKGLMIDSLEEPTPEIIEGKKRIILRGEFVCHEDIPYPIAFDRSFTVCGEDTDVVYLVMIQKIDL